LAIFKIFIFSEVYDKLVRELKVRHDKLRYLTSYFVDTRRKMEAARLKLDEMELKLRRKEERSK
jgi:nitrate/TMAO reductase-like tetraheme cytochrome c subunit